MLAVGFSPDGAFLASGSGRDLSGDNTVRLWDAHSGQLLRVLTGHAGAVNAVDVSPDSKLLASGSGDNTIRLWDASSGQTSGQPSGQTSGQTLGQPLRTLIGHSSAVTSVAFSPDGTLLASGSVDNTVRLWDAQSGQVLRILAGHTSEVTSVAFSPDGALLASGSGDADPGDDNTVRLWDASSGRALRTLSGHTRGVTSVAFSPDGALLASGSWDYSVRLWSMRSNQQRPGQRTRVPGPVTSVDFSPDGKLLAVALRDHTMRLWDVSSGREQRVLTGHSTAVTSVRFSPDGRRLASASGGVLGDNTVRLWDIESGAWVLEMWGLDQGGWLTRRPDGTMWRADDGSSLLLSGLDHHAPLPAPGLAGGTELTTDLGTELTTDLGTDLTIDLGADLTIDVPENITLRLGELQTIVVHLQNRGDPQRTMPAYQVRVRSPIPIVGEIIGMGMAPGYHARLDPGAEPVAVAVQLSYSHDPGSHELQGPRAVTAHTLTLSLESARAEPIAVTIPVRVLGPELHVRDFEVLRDPSARSASVQFVVENRGEHDAAAAGTTEDRRGVRVYTRYRDAATSELLHESRAQEIPAPFAPGAMSEPLSFTVPEDVLQRSRGSVVIEVVMVSGIWPTLQWVMRRPFAPPAQPTPWLVYGGIALGLLLLGAAVAYQLIFRNPVVTRLTREPAAVRDIPIHELAHCHGQLARARRLAPILSAADIPREAWARVRATAHEPRLVLAATLRMDVHEHNADDNPDNPVADDDNPVTDDDNPVNPVNNNDPDNNDPDNNSPDSNNNDDNNDSSRIGPREPLTEGVTLYPLHLPRLPIPIERATALIELQDPAPTDLIDILTRAIEARELHGRRYLFLIEHQQHGAAAARLATSQLRVVVLGPRDITRIALAPRPADELCRVIASQARLGDISPYQTSGGVRQGVQFFGRHNELAQLISSDARNHLIIGARQMGKSSLLRRLHERAPERMHMVTLTGANMDADLKGAGLPALHDIGPDEQGRVPFLLLDEADKLIAEDRDNDYALCRRLRAMSEEGRCRFVLAGFWELHHAAYLEHQSPVRNFANPMPLGPLDDRSARELATQPLDHLGLRWADDALIDVLLQRTGRRPNLIALACDAAIRALEPLSQRVIDADLLNAVLDVDDESGKSIADFFGDIGQLIHDDRAGLIDRMVMYATVDCRGDSGKDRDSASDDAAGDDASDSDSDSDSFTLTQAHDIIQAAGASVPIDELRESLSRLTLAYIIQRRRGAYIYPVPLIRDVLRADCDHDPQRTLELETRAWRDRYASS